MQATHLETGPRPSGGVRPSDAQFPATVVVDVGSDFGPAPGSVRRFGGAR